jgi:hypothetical protein
LGVIASGAGVLTKDDIGIGIAVLATNDLEGDAKGAGLASGTLSDGASVTVTAGAVTIIGHASGTTLTKTSNLYAS